MKYFVGSILGVFIFSIASVVAIAQQESEGRLVGSWNATTTPRVCATGDAITMFKATYNFDQGGTLNFVSSGTGSGGRGREQVGPWKHVTGNRYRFALKAYIFDANGVSSSYQIVAHEAELSEDGLSWSSVGISKTYNFAGAEINSGCSTIVATRDSID